jgi:hypothetical protein
MSIVDNKEKRGRCEERGCGTERDRGRTRRKTNLTLTHRSHMLGWILGIGFK